MADALSYASLIRLKLGLESPAKYVPELRARCADPDINPLLNSFLEENQAQVKLRDGWKQSATAKAIFKLDGDRQLQILFATCAEILDEKPRTLSSKSNEPYQHIFRCIAAKELVSALLRKPLPFTEADLVLLLRVLAHCHAFSALPVAGLLRVVLVYKARNNPLPQGLDQALRRLRHELHRKIAAVYYSDVDKNTATIDRLLSSESPPQISLDLNPGEAWSDAAIAFLADANPADRSKWMDLLLHAKTADGARPTRKWLAAASERVKAVGDVQFRETVSSWLSLVEKPRTQSKPAPTSRYDADPNLLIEGSHANILKGLAWCCIGLDNVLLARSLGDAGCAAFKKVPLHGPRCVKLANAVVVALSEMPGLEPTAQLGRLGASAKHSSARGYVAKGLAKVADRTGQTAEDLAELAVPTFGLGSDGKLARTLGSFIGEIKIVAADDVKLNWRRTDGKAQKAVPSDVKREHTEALKGLTRSVRDIRKMLPAQRVRIERVLMGQRQWLLADWKARYAEHPLMSNLSRRLIWEVIDDGKSLTAILMNGVLVDASDTPVPVTPQSHIRLWHPIRSTPEQVLAWRAWLEQHRMTQPFKQAHREIYILTDAETRTVTYSNRFAAHMLRQQQFAALAQARGWVYRLQGDFDSHNNPTLRLPQYDLRVEWWVESFEEGNETTETGIYTHIATDQVRFFRLDGVEPLELTAVDPLLFTEVMRDLDLFVGVTSVGNDPQWQDAGTAFGGYWHSFSFGDLGESSKTRKAVLEKLVPRLKISARCSITEKFLVVRGDLHTYKIHLGSGSILFGSNDQYLCIVPDRSTKARDELFLPFEGDSTLSIIISKAFLLANDAKIEDPSITRQIKPV